jgi:hypothetical protein
MVDYFGQSNEPSSSIIIVIFFSESELLSDPEEGNCYVELGMNLEGGRQDLFGKRLILGVK